MQYKMSHLALFFVVIGFYGCNPDRNENVYDYSLTDINSSSNTYGESIGPGYFAGQVTLHYFGHQYWDQCSSLVGELDSLDRKLQIEGITNIKIIAIGKSQYSYDNSQWIYEHSIHIVIDPSPNYIWSTWGASQWDLFFLDSNGEYVKDFNINPWDYDTVYNAILELSSPGT